MTVSAATVGLGCSRCRLDSRPLLRTAIPRSDRQVWENTQVWAADNWYAPADAEISGLYLYDPANLAQAIDVQDGYAHTVFNEQDWWLVRRDHQASDGWHPVNDDLAGTADAYGVMSTDPLADSTWSVPFGDGTDLLPVSYTHLTLPTIYSV